MLKKRLLLLVMLVLVPSVISVSVDLNDDNCVDDNDISIIIEKYGSGNFNIYDMNGDKIVNSNDYRIIDVYRKDDNVYKDDCEGYTCTTEQCNEIDDDCDLEIDEDVSCNEEEIVILNTQCVKEGEKDKYVKSYTTFVDEVGKTTISYDHCIVVNGSKVSSVDDCSGEECYLLEYDCRDNKELMYRYSCDYICVDGACVDSETDVSDKIDFDSSLEYCEAMDDYEWINGECCGDDFEEYVVCEDVWCLCCSSSEYVYLDGECVLESVEEVSGNYDISTGAVFFLGIVLLVIIIVALLYSQKPQKKKRKKK